MTVAQDIQKPFLNAAIVELFQLDATSLGEDIFYFTNQTNEKGTSVVFDGNTYAPISVMGEGWSKSLTGAAPRPTLTIDNTNRLMQAVVISAGDLVGTLLTRIRVISTYLDASNFYAGNVNADPTAILSRDVFIVDRKSAHNNKSIQWELCWVLDRPGFRIPARQVLRDFGFPGVGINRR